MSKCPLFKNHNITVSGIACLPCENCEVLFKGNSSFETNLTETRRAPCIRNGKCYLGPLNNNTLLQTSHCDVR